VLEPIDLRHLGAENVIGVYLLETRDGPALFDCGPTTCVEALKAALADRSLDLRDIRHLLLSHIHLDHAGAAGVLVREHPDLRVHVSGAGAPHLADPSRLEASARRLYGDAFDDLWGELAPVPRENIDVAEGEAAGLTVFPTPGHAIHHVCYLDDAGTLYAGDAAGVRIAPHRAVLPPTPPPDFDLDAWERTLDEIEARQPERLALIHFGVVADDVGDHLGRLRERLRTWSERVRIGAAEADFVATAEEDLRSTDGTDPFEYERAMPFWQSYAGLKRYWDKRRAA
jgi:glyoxylase-like metal-dependent hydrolase (beta-lactamase superfamily II)